MPTTAKASLLLSMGAEGLESYHLPFITELFLPDSRLGGDSTETTECIERTVSSTASQPELPFTQVRRTPYMNVHGKGRDPQNSPSKLMRMISPLAVY